MAKIKNMFRTSWGWERGIEVEVCKHKQRFPDLGLEKIIYNSQMQVKVDSKTL